MHGIGLDYVNLRTFPTEGTGSTITTTYQSSLSRTGPRRIFFGRRDTRFFGQRSKTEKRHTVIIIILGFFFSLFRKRGMWIH